VVFFPACFRPILLDEMGIPKPIGFVKTLSGHLKNSKMKKGIVNQYPHMMRELPEESCEMIRGGDAIWYWVTSCVSDFLSYPNGSISSGQRLYNAALG
jgi:hypothetical protein